MRVTPALNYVVQRRQYIHFPLSNRRTSSFGPPWINHSTQQGVGKSLCFITLRTCGALELPFFQIFLRSVISLYNILVLFIFFISRKKWLSAHSTNIFVTAIILVQENRIIEVKEALRAGIKSFFIRDGGGYIERIGYARSTRDEPWLRRFPRHPGVLFTALVSGIWLGRRAALTRID